MPLRLIEAYLPGVSWEEMQGFFEEQPLLSVRHDEEPEGFLHVRLLVSMEDDAPILDGLERRFASRQGFQIIVYPVKAAIPRPKVPEKPPEPDEEKPPPQTPVTWRPVVGREELYGEIAGTSNLSYTYVDLVALSSIVAGIGILRDSPAVVIGAMVIAPLLGPNVALSLATTLASWNLGETAIKALGVGILIALIISFTWGAVLHVDPAMPGLVERTEVGIGDIVLALASGSAGVLSYTTGMASALVGVMVAVALLPPLIACGLLLGSWHLAAAGGAFLVFLNNVICINLAGVVTFLVQGVRPLSWWEARKARKALRMAIPIWVVLLVVLVAAIVFSQY